MASPNLNNPTVAYASGFNNMSERLAGCLKGEVGAAHGGSRETLAYLEGMLARLDETRLHITETIVQHEHNIARHFGIET